LDRRHHKSGSVCLLPDFGPVRPDGVPRLHVCIWRMACLNAPGRLSVPTMSAA
jgi:hypothetical protein